MKLFALILFVLTYALMIALPKHRPWVALTSAVVFLVSGIVPLASLREAIDFNVLLMLAGTMGTVSLFIQSQMPNRMAEMILKKTPNVCGLPWQCRCLQAWFPPLWTMLPRC